MNALASHRITAEFSGTALLLAIVVGSGIMGATLANGNDAIALLGNSIATGAGLYVLITVLGPISGAHFNPVVSLTFWRSGDLTSGLLIAYVAAQVLGGIIGVWLTHLMFDLPVIQLSSKVRTGVSQWVSEFLATAVLLATIHLGLRHAADRVPMLVALIVTAGYWFTASTFFSNPAVTIARAFSNTFAGIQPADVAGFIAAQSAACLLACAFVGRRSPRTPEYSTLPLRASAASLPTSASACGCNRASAIGGESEVSLSRF
jgi:glycerol uptake facilitator-like aquaporin